MSQKIYAELSADIESLKRQGLYKEERTIQSPQSGHIRTYDKDVINLCANNYLGLADNKEVIAQAEQALHTYGYGMASVRFICGTQTIHKELEKRLSSFLGTEDTILYSSCFDANGGLFEALLGPEDAIISDELNHASIIDGIRLCKAARYRYKNNDMNELEKILQETKTARRRLIATDGVFSMDGTIAHLKIITELAERYDALVMVDDSHAVGFMGENGRGTHEYAGVMGKVDIITGTLGKALGGASGGYTSGKREVVEWLRQRSRPYLFSNSLAPMIASASLAVLDFVEKSPALREKLTAHTRFFRKEMTRLGFDIPVSDHPIVPIMVYDATIASQMAARLFAEGIYVVGFSYPVVPMGKARIRTQMSAALSEEDLKRAISCFEKVGRDLKII